MLKATSCYLRSAEGGSSYLLPKGMQELSSCDTWQGYNGLQKLIAHRSSKLDPKKWPSLEFKERSNEKVDDTHKGQLLSKKENRSEE
jgi:hypothetical protein